MADKKKSGWKPEGGDEEDALKALIRAAVMNAGPIDPAVLPSKVKERIRGRATGDLDVDGYIEQVIAETRKKQR